MYFRNVNSIEELIKKAEEIIRIINTDNPNLTLDDLHFVEQDTKIKPQGLWYGINDSWLEWTALEMPGHIKDYNYEIKINTSNILVLKTFEDLIKFSYKYSCTVVDNFILYIDWGAVAQEYDGIEIPEYIREARLNDKTSWYYGWDVASGCIWNPKAIISIEKTDKYNPEEYKKKQSLYYDEDKDLETEVISKNYSGMHKISGGDI